MPTSSSRRNSLSNSFKMVSRNKSDKSMSSMASASASFTKKKTKKQQQGGERTVQEEAEFHGLNRDEIVQFADVKSHYEIQCEDKNQPCLFSDTQLLRVAMFCKFNQTKALSLLGKIDPRHFHLTAFALQDQLQTQTLFPLSPELTSKDGKAHVFYMRPSRFSPKTQSTANIIANLLYVMNQMDCRYPKTLKCRKGINNKEACHKIAFVANMADWTMQNFGTEYCFKFMQCLQGHVFPVKVNLFLIVNPPSWFGKVWSIMKPMLGAKFQQKVHMIPEDQLGNFLSDNYPQHLPNEFESPATATADTVELVESFILERQRLERLAGQDPTCEDMTSNLDLNISGHSSSFYSASASKKDLLVEGARTEI